MNEFELIERFFLSLSKTDSTTTLGIGDDAAIVNLKADEQLVVSTDTHLEAVHFPRSAAPGKIAYRSVVTSVSDLAAMGAKPRWATLALSLPSAAENFIREFSHGAGAALDACQTSLIGGDTTRGPCAITWTILGTVPRGTALRRDGAKPGDAIYVSGALGAATAALQFLERPGTGGALEGSFLAHYWTPQPRIDFAYRLRGLASACIDISDGLLADVGHIAKASHCQAMLRAGEIPVSTEVCELLGFERAQFLALRGGDDYELCFTVPPARQALVDVLAREHNLTIARIGRMERGAGVQFQDGEPAAAVGTGYQHFE